jgi:cytochrome c biogenesis protein CcdA
MPIPAEGPVLYGFSLGLVAAVNPCGFPLLPAYVMMSAGEARAVPLRVRAIRALGAGGAMTAGFVVVFTALGALIKLGMTVAMGWIPWVMVPAGVGLVVAGSAVMAGRDPARRLASLRMPSVRSQAAKLVVFGIAYAVASLGCALPLFVLGVVGSFGQRGVLLGVLTGLAYAMGMGLVVTAVSLAGAGARQIRCRRIRSLQPVLSRVAGLVVAVVGAYLVVYWVSALAGTTGAPAPVRAVEWVQAQLAQGLSGSPRVVGSALGAIVVVTLAVAFGYGSRDAIGSLPAASRSHADGQSDDKS